MTQDSSDAQASQAEQPAAADDGEDSSRVQPMAGRVALVTGGASGLGRATSLCLAAAGAHVVVADIDDQGASVTVEQVRKAGGKATSVHLDVTDSQQVDRVVDETAATYGSSFDCLVNNAGLDRGSDILEVSDEQWHRVFGVNVDGPMRMTRAFLRHLNGGGQRRVPADVVCVVSISAVTVGTGASAYNASKAALLKFTEVLQAEARERGLPVRACALSPSAMDTPMMEQWNLPQEKMMDPSAIGRLIVNVVTLPPDMMVQSLIVTSRVEQYPR